MAQHRRETPPASATTGNTNTVERRPGYTAYVTSASDAQADDGMIDMPRNQFGRPPQHLLMTLLGDYWLSSEAMLPSAALVKLVEEFDITAIAGRAALSRLARRDLLVSAKRGRNTFYTLAEPARRTMRNGARRIVSFGSGARQWDGEWTVAAFSLPEDKRDLRHLTRSRLRWLGFASLFDGVWISPNANPSDTRQELVNLGVSTASVMIARELPDPDPLRRLMSVWNLDELQGQYEAFIAEHDNLVQKVRRGSVGPAEAMIARTSLMDSYRRFPALDPELPDELMPSGWSRKRAREIFVEMYDMLGSLAEVRVRQIVGEFAPELTASVHHHTVAELLAD